jgi:4-hydroxyphenylacetate 3-monooxygenase
LTHFLLGLLLLAKKDIRKNMLKTGSQYLKDQNDGRAVYIDGELIKNVVLDHRLSGGAQTVAELYDLQNRPDLIATMSFTNDAGERIGRTFQEPRTREELKLRTQSIRHWMNHTYGIFGRSPDYMSVILASMNAAADFFDESKINTGFGANVRNYYKQCSENDLTLTHVNVNPQVDRSKAVHEQEHDIACKVVKETDAGFYVDGARMVATLGE